MGYFSEREILINYSNIVISLSEDLALTQPSRLLQPRDGCRTSPKTKQTFSSSREKKIFFVIFLMKDWLLEKKILGSKVGSLYSKQPSSVNIPYRKNFKNWRSASALVSATQRGVVISYSANPKIKSCTRGDDSGTSDKFPLARIPHKNPGLSKCTRHRDFCPIRIRVR